MKTYPYANYVTALVVIPALRQRINNLCICISGYVDDGNPKWQVCPNDCKLCDQKLDCINCNIDNSIVNHFGRCNYFDGYLMQNQECLSCHYSFQKCNGLLNLQCTLCDVLSEKQQ